MSLQIQTQERDNRFSYIVTHNVGRTVWTSEWVEVPDATSHVDVAVVAIDEAKRFETLLARRKASKAPMSDHDFDVTAVLLREAQLHEWVMLTDLCRCGWEQPMAWTHPAHIVEKQLAGLARAGYLVVPQ